MPKFSHLGVAVIGTGFIGGVHVGALRRLGLRIQGVLGSSAGRGAEGAAALGVDRAYASLEELLDDRNVDVVHVTSPNHAHYHQVKAILAAGKHVICEKPLSLTSAQSAEMVQLARASACVAAVCYNIRFYPLNQHAHQMVKDDALGDIRFVTGHYHQDWLAKPTDWNWRLETETGGALRSVGDIGTHWVDLIGFVTGQKPNAVFAELTTFIPERQKPVGPVATFSNDDPGKTEARQIATDDAAMIMMKFPNGARGVMSTSQINSGRKNSLQWDVAGADASAAWDSEVPDHLWIGHRDAPNQILQRDPGLMNDAGRAAANVPGGHVEGFGDSFYSFFRAVYSDIVAGGRSEAATYASFDDGHYEMLFCDSVLQSAKEGRWVEVNTT